MKVKITNYIISFIFIIYYYFSIATSYSLIVVNKGGWFLGEWLINYQDGGFKRRGLFGSLFIFINEITNINLEYIVFAFLFILYSLFFYLFIKLFWKEKNNLLVIALILLPAGFGMMVKHPEIASKKEALFFLLYLLYFLSLRSKVIIKDYVITLFILIAILTHEMAFFYLPFVSFTYFVKNDRPSIDKIKKIFFYQFLPATAAMMILYKFGVNITTVNTVQFFKNHGLVFKELGIFEYNPNYNVLDYYKSHSYSYQMYVISIFLGSFTFYIYCKFNQVKISTIFLAIQVIFLLPLFYIAVDWGRWVNIFFSLLTIFMIGEQKLVLTRKQEIITIIIIFFNLWWKMLLRTEGFLTFTIFDNFLKQTYYFIFYNLKNIFNLFFF
ncbi:hypothetical protein [Chryseobacterium sp. ERMR1:04]|uniref:hypothetical protein n=1 Tax=Chryseobacterium sp. ERMR1:04 TaxID=1705393 RepID=UPI0006C844F7|nr:hypothetical protein [Chryseobacterium sp. ERMR1:04]KPH11472.1 hypothetical protein AMQ68_18885 [Chryseobacterium sp. ERMR1:04]